MKTFIVYHFHAVQIEVQAEDGQEAMYLAENDDKYQYTLTAKWDNRKGAPEVCLSNYDTEWIDA